MKQLLDRYFNIRASGSSIPVEVLAGFSTFLALSYIFIVNPSILAEAGMDRSAVLFATITASALATIIMGLWARLPFVLAPGMEMNSYVAFFVVRGLGFSWQQAMGAVFWAGILCLVFTGLSIRERIINAIPHRMKAGLALCVGTFLAIIGLRLSGLLVYEGVTLHGLGKVATIEVVAMMFGLAIALVLEHLRVRGAVLLSIVATSVFCHIVGLGTAPTPAAASPSGGFLSAVGSLDPSVVLDPRMLSVILVLFVVDFYGSVAKFIGLTENTPIMIGGRVPRMGNALWVDGGATVAGSILGTSSIITYVESAVGIGAGGRTGLASLVCGLLMLACYTLAPLIAYVPIHATTGILMLIGIKLCPPLRELEGYSWADRIILLLMLVTVAATFAIDRAVLIGFLGYLATGLASRQKPDPFLVFSTLLLAIGVGLQMVNS